MKICCAGTYRSGSTWLFNAVRLLRPDAEVIKRHPPSLDKYDMVLTSHRDLRRVAASLWRKWGSVVPDYNWDNVWRALDEVKTFHSFWTKHVKFVFDMKYEDMMLDPKWMFLQVCDAVEGTSPDKAWKELISLAQPKEGVDKVTHIHWNHVTSKSLSTDPLTESEVVAIQKRYLEWQKERGYA